jgi:hypothetical protein
MMDLSYQEKSILGSVLAMTVVYAYYFANAFRQIGQPQFDSGTLGRLIFTVIAIVVIEIVYHVALAIRSKPQPKDERDVLIESKAYRTAYFTMFTGMSLVVTWLIVAGLADAAVPGKLSIAPFLMVNVILLVLVATELLKFLTQLFLYRWGVR